MDNSDYFGARDILTLLDAPTSVLYPPAGGVRVEKAGIHGIGRTPVDAAADWGRRFAAMVTLPRGFATNDDREVSRGQG